MLTILLIMLEAWVGIEPAYADLQSAQKSQDGAVSAQFVFRNSELIHRAKSFICKDAPIDCGTESDRISPLALAGSDPGHDVRDLIQPELVTSYRSEPGETMNRFALTIFRNAVHKTKAINAEICGEFRREGASLVLDLYTIGEIEACSYAKTHSDAYTGISFHTHTIRGIAWFTEEDYGHPGYMARGNALLFQTGKGTMRRLR